MVEKVKKKHNLGIDFELKPLTLVYEEERHWPSSEPLTPQVGTSAAGETTLATPGFSKGVLGAEELAVGAPSGKARGKSTSSSAPISALPGPPSGLGRLSRSNSRSSWTRQPSFWVKRTRKFVTSSKGQTTIIFRACHPAATMNIALGSAKIN